MGRETTPPCTTCSGSQITSTSPCLCAPSGSEGRNASATRGLQAPAGRSCPVSSSKASTGSRLPGAAQGVQIIPVLFCLSSTPSVFPRTSYHPCIARCLSQTAQLKATPGKFHNYYCSLLLLQNICHCHQEKTHTKTKTKKTQN